ncbi:MAG: NADH-quinone oxidoreductase subunit J [Bryobacterales bacterium]|nr:NADH-quinone oxidoreductase subunit J [Bryobacterales bacterium]
MDLILFSLLAIVAVGCAISLVMQTHPISSAISLIGVMVSLAGLYLLLGAEFIAAAQIIVYAGAIMVLFTIVIMLVNTKSEEPGRMGNLSRLLGLPLLFVMVGLMAVVLVQVSPPTRNVVFGEFSGGGPGDIGILLFTKYVLPFEATSVLILVAITGAVVLALKEMD